MLSHSKIINIKNDFYVAKSKMAALEIIKIALKSMFLWEINSYNLTSITYYK